MWCGISGNPHVFFVLVIEMEISIDHQTIMFPHQTTIVYIISCISLQQCLYYNDFTMWDIGQNNVQVSFVYSEDLAGLAYPYIPRGSYIPV